ncbi:MAG TPA: hypothetical protein VHV81_09680 [Steroidobacteraceae bacterium]|jgi:hypothetical protein|nr:hypothetical protein [Steroidobacteraceae bacterium]
MSAAPLTVLPLFSVPFGIVALPGADRLQESLLEACRSRRAADGAPRANPLVHRTRDDLFEWPEEAPRRLATEMLRAVVSVIDAVSQLEPDDRQALRIEARGWMTVIEENGRVPAATFPLTAWAALYCVAAPPPSVRSDSGVLRLFESRLGTMFQDATNSVMRLPFSAGHYTWRPVPGSVVVFPASLTHEITLVRAPGSLVLATARVRFVGPQQAGLGRW